MKLVDISGQKEAKIEELETNRKEKKKKKKKKKIGTFIGASVTLRRVTSLKLI